MAQERALKQPKALSGNRDEMIEFIDQYDTFLIDCDGVLWSGNDLFEDTVEGIEALRKRGKKVIFVSNNATKSRVEYGKKLNGMGIPATPDDFFGSAYSAALYIKNILKLPPNKRKVFVISEAGVEEELASEGIKFIGGTDPAFQRDITTEDFSKIASGEALDPEVGVVLAALDFHVSYLKLSLAYHYIQRGALFLATNLDVALPSAGALFPGAGAIMAPLIRLQANQDPPHCGKPSQIMMDAIESKAKFDRKRTCMIGDRLDTDMVFGKEGGLGTLCVLTGVAQKSDWETGKWEAPLAYLEKIGDFKLAMPN